MAGRGGAGHGHCCYFISIGRKCLHVLLRARGARGGALIRGSGRGGPWRPQAAPGGGARKQTSHTSAASEEDHPLFPAVPSSAVRRLSPPVCLTRAPLERALDVLEAAAEHAARWRHPAPRTAAACVASIVAATRRSLPRGAGVLSGAAAPKYFPHCLPVAPLHLIHRRRRGAPRTATTSRRSPRSHDDMAGRPGRPPSTIWRESLTGLYGVTCLRLHHLLHLTGPSRRRRGARPALPA